MSHVSLQFVGSSDGASSTSDSGYQGNGAGLGSVGWGAADDGDDEEPPNHSCHSHILSQCEASTSFQVRKLSMVLRFVCWSRLNYMYSIY